MIGPYFFAGVALGVLYWILDAAVMAFFMREGPWLELLFSPGSEDVWTRSFTASVFILAGATVNALQHRHIRIEGRENDLGRILENSLNEIFIFDAETLKFCFVNRGARENLGYKMQELRGLTPLDIKPEHTAESFAKLIEPLRSGAEELIVFHTVHLREDRTTYGVEVHLQRTTYDESPAFVAIILDTTRRDKAEEERRKLEDRVQHAQKLESLGVLAGGIAHDFNNLLVGMLGNADLALGDMAPTSPGRPYLSDIVKSAQKAAALCNQMLAYSGKGRFVVRAVDLSTIVEEMLHLLQISISKNAVLKTHFAPNLPAVEADVTQIQQVIMNLITNASEAIGEKSGVITVSTGAMECDRAYLRDTYLDEDLPEGTYVYLEVSDTGEGMDEETRSQIFDPFFTSKFTGRGLGLAAVLGIVRGHRGAIKVYTEPGKGTSFKLLLPATDQRAEDISESRSATPEWLATGKALVVDDEETVRVLAKRILEAAGFEVLLAVDGREGVEVFREHAAEISVVLLDMTMPHMNGDEAFREMRRIDNNARVVLSSGYNEQEATNRFAGKGLAGFIQKPYRRSELLDAVREAIAD